MATSSFLLLIGCELLLLSAIPASCQGQASTPEPIKVLSSQGQAATPEPMSDTCMGCICEAASKCDRARQCRNGICGLFAITRPYWEDAGKPVIPGDAANRPGAFERCVTEPFCAARTVQEYMTRFSQDCDGNGIVNCEDYAAVHHLGRGCEGRLDNSYKRDFQACQRRVKPGRK